MAARIKHSQVTAASGNHVQQRWVVLDEAARLAIVPTQEDVGGVCFQFTPRAVFDLVGVAPTTWKQRFYVGDTIPGGGYDSHYVHTQGSPSATWTIVHNLGKRPAITVLDSAGDECEGEIRHDSNNQATITFSAPFSGTATCN